jgi:hypothetical protein
VRVVVVIARPFRFADDDPKPMLRHLDDWARRTVTTPEVWASTLERCDQWVDYSARNQVLLASYGVATPVAGMATWERLASVEPDRSCAVRAGEHGLPVRSPIVTPGDVASDRIRSGARSESMVAKLRWETVFALEQLARRPNAGALASPVVPVLGEREWCEAVRVASGRMIGRTPRKVADPVAQLATLAGRVVTGSGRTKLDDTLATQAAVLVAARAGQEAAPLARFDPTGLSARERWRTLVDVRHATGEVLRAVSFAVGVDLRAPVVPRHDLVDDRTVAPGRRNCLAPADVRGLPTGVWIEAGPYTKAEWLARGVAGGNGVGAFCRVNDRSYLAVYGTRTGAMWRLETVGRGAHRGVVGEGVADTLTAGKDAARLALTERFPDVARHLTAEAPSVVVGPQHGWVPLVGGRDARTEHRVVDERIAAMVSPGPGGRWQTWLTVDGAQSQGPLTATASEARIVADALAAGALMDLAAVAPDRANRLVHDAATSAGWDRSTLTATVGSRLTEADRATLSATTDPEVLVVMMRNTGVLAPATMLAVLHAEHVDADTAVSLVQAIGMPIPDAIRSLHDRWGMDRVDAGQYLGATVDELRAAGCSPVEMLAVSPREELRRLDTREHTWELAAPTLLEAGYSLADTVAHLAAHAPTPATFAAGVTAIIDQPVDAFALAARHATIEDLSTLSERYGLSPTDTATALALAGVAAGAAVGVLDLRCDHHPTVVRQHAWDALGIDPSQTDQLLSRTDATAVEFATPGRAVEHEPVAIGVEL